MNREQQKAVEHKEGPLLVIAGAGSGKTRIVTHRIARLLEEGVSPSQILGLTFTNKAAGEMKKRVEELVGKRVLISTFHSLGALILRESIQTLGYSRHFSIYDQEDAEKLLKSCLGPLPLTERKKGLKLFLSAISSAKNALLSPSDLASSNPEEPLAAEIYALYQARLKESDAVDFDDLLFLPVSLFKREPSLLESYQRRWPYILVDEYQDTNAAQYALVKLLSQKSGNLFVVGDPDQSIYSWRGAKIENILNFEKDFPGAEVVHLEQNYRSRNRILEAANALISRNCNRYHKSLWSERGEGEKIELELAEDEQGEADFVVERVEDYKMKGEPLSEIAVFYRTNFQSRVLEDAFLAAKIPYTLVGGVSFYQRKEIKDLLALLRMAVSGSDFVAFQRTFALEKRGMGPATLERMRLASLAEELPIFDYALALARGEPLQHPLRLNRTQHQELVRYTGMITELKARAASGAVSETVRAAIALAEYEALLQRDPESYSERRENIFELMAKAIEWEGRREKPELTEFLGELTLKSSLDQVGQETDSVRLMTLHHGKGLEFDAVFLVGLEEDLFPHFNSKASQEGLEEERRLFYVGMTRAKERLYLSLAARRLLWGSWRPMEPSRFIRELPRELLRFR